MNTITVISNYVQSYLQHRDGRLWTTSSRPIFKTTTATTKLHLLSTTAIIIDK